MSGSGFYPIIANNGKQDEILYQHERLKANIAFHKQMRQQKITGGDTTTSPYPSLEEIEKTHILFTNISFRAFAKICFDYLKVPKTGVSFNSQINFEIPHYGDFFSDMVLNVVIDSATASATVPQGSNNDPSDVALWRYCNHPGEKLISNFTFSVASSNLDSYDRIVYPLTRQTMLTPNKLAGWNRCMGQSSDLEAYYGYPTTAGTTPQPQVMKFALSGGYQTYQTTQPALNLFIPLLFWFNEPRQAIPGLAIPFGQRVITATISPQSDICRAIVNPGARNAVTAPLVPALNISTCDLWIQNMFVSDEIQEIYSNRVGFNLVRVHLSQNITLNTPTGQQILNSMKWPITQLTVVFQPSVNNMPNTNVTTRASQVSVIDPAMEDWNRFGLVSTNSVAAGTVNGTSSTATYVTKSVSDHMVNIGISAFGNDIYKAMPSAFFNCYTTYKYGADTVTPSDPGVFFIPFCLFPNSYQPSGHLNTSKLREFYLNYTSNYITSNNTVVCYVSAVAINFLMITKGSAGLRFVT
jgi:hypothetical protein